MSRDVEIFLVDAFTEEAGKGNRAGVVFEADGLTETQMQKIAAFANVSETAFLLSSDEADLHVRYFTPTAEVPLCGHATIASHYLRTLKLGLDSRRLMCKTGAGILPVDIERDGDDVKIIMTQGTPEFGEIIQGELLEELLAALSLSQDDLINGLPVQFTSAGHGKLNVPINSLDRLHALTPDFDGLIKISEKTGYKGYFIMTIHDEGPYKTHGRMFAPAIGINEDPVTGNGNGPAGLYLAHHDVITFDDQISYMAIQGEAMGKPGEIEVRVFKEDGRISKVQVAGSAVEAGILNFSV